MRILPILLKVAMLTPVLSMGYSLTAHANSAQNLFKPFVVDFNDLDPGTYITGTEWAAREKGGLTIGVDSNRKLKRDKNLPKDERSDLPLRLYDSNCRPSNIDVDHPRFAEFADDLPTCSGDDGDLSTAGSFSDETKGNVLIIQEDNSRRRNRDNLGEADDERKGGTITFNFGQAIQYISLGFLDFDEKGKGEFRFYSGSNDTEAALTLDIKDVQAMNPDFTGDNSLRLFENVIEGTEVAFKRLEIEFPGSGAITHLCFSPEEVAPGGSHNWADDAESCRW